MLNDKSLFNKMQRQHRSNNIKIVPVLQKGWDKLKQVNYGSNTDQNITNYNMDIVKKCSL